MKSVLVNSEGWEFFLKNLGSCWSIGHQDICNSTCSVEGFFSKTKKWRWRWYGHSKWYQDLRIYISRLFSITSITWLMGFCTRVVFQLLGRRWLVFVIFVGCLFPRSFTLGTPHCLRECAKTRSRCHVPVMSFRWLFVVQTCRGNPPFSGSRGVLKLDGFFLKGWSSGCWVFHPPCQPCLETGPFSNDYCFAETSNGWVFGWLVERCDFKYIQKFSSLQKIWGEISVQRHYNNLTKKGILSNASLGSVKYTWAEKIRCFPRRRRGSISAPSSCNKVSGEERLVFARCSLPKQKPWWSWL